MGEQRLELSGTIVTTSSGDYRVITCWWDNESDYEFICIHQPQHCGPPRWFRVLCNPEGHDAWSSALLLCNLNGWWIEWYN